MKPAVFKNNNVRYRVSFQSPSILEAFTVLLYCGGAGLLNDQFQSC